MMIQVIRAKSFLAKGRTRTGQWCQLCASEVVHFDVPVYDQHSKMAIPFH